MINRLFHCVELRVWTGSPALVVVVFQPLVEVAMVSHLLARAMEDHRAMEGRQAMEGRRAAAKVRLQALQSQPF